MGRLKPEDPLPSVRQLALDLTINPNTVARAYLELEHQGFIYKRQGQGTYVCMPALGAARRERNKIVAGLFEKAIAEADTQAYQQSASPNQPPSQNARPNQSAGAQEAVPVSASPKQHRRRKVRKTKQKTRRRVTHH